jgi:hypothetical protein
LGQIPKLLAAVRAFAALPESPALAAANKRIGNILKKADEVDAHVNPALLKEIAEQDLHQAIIGPIARCRIVIAFALDHAVDQAGGHIIKPRVFIDQTIHCGGTAGVGRLCGGLF